MDRQKLSHPDTERPLPPGYAVRDDSAAKRDRAGAVLLISAVLRMGHHIGGRPDFYTPEKAVEEASALYDEVTKLCGVAPAKAF